VLFGPGRGLRFWLDFEHQLRFGFGLYESELAPWLRRLSDPGRVAYDVGADIGYQALVIARLTLAPVVAFEPREDSARRIERHYDLNRDQVGRVEVVRRAVGACRDTSLTLDTYASGSPLGPPGLLFVDVDGAEVDVLVGATDLLAQAHPHVVVETHSPELEESCLEVLGRAGYVPVIVKNRRVLGDYRPIAHNRWIAATGR
jgi:hypothetical protein